MQLPDLQDFGYQVTLQLGSGQFGAVYKGQYINTGSRQNKPRTLSIGSPVAIKFSKAKDVRPNEVLLQAQLQHINIIRIYDVFRVTMQERPHPVYLCIVMELADFKMYHLTGPSLWDNIEKVVHTNMRLKVFKEVSPKAQFTMPLRGGEPIMRWIFVQLVAALDYLHQHPKRLCNRDVKPDNILITAFKQHSDNVMRPMCKLGDFGFSKAQQEEVAISRLGTCNYVAPEIVQLQKGQDYPADKSDVWSTGIVLYVLATGLIPFKHSRADSDVDVLNRVIDVNYMRASVLSDARLEGMTEELKDLLRRMLQHDPRKRPSMWEVMHHAWCKKLNTDIAAGVDGDHVQRFVPCWDLYVHEAKRNVDQMKARAKSAEASTAPGQRVVYDWCLPHLDYEELEKELIDIEDIGKTNDGNARAGYAPPASNKSGFHAAMDASATPPAVVASGV